MEIYIDGDGCPVVDMTIKIAQENKIPCTIITDTAHIFSKEYDIVVTQDYGLAAMCLSKKAKAINQNGLVYSHKNIDSLLMTRYIGKKARMSGIRTKGPKKRTKEQNKAFAKELQRLIRSE